MNYNLTNLKELEAESIHIIREVAAEFENPVMLYSIGKDSSVMVRLAEKAFAPGKVPFPLMHIDSKWKFKEMTDFRDRYAKEKNWDLIVHYNKKGFEEGEHGVQNARVQRRGGTIVQIDGAHGFATLTFLADSLFPL